VQERARDRKALAHAPGKLSRQSVFHARKPDVLERRIRGRFRFRDSRKLAEQRQVFNR